MVWVQSPGLGCGCLVWGALLDPRPPLAWAGPVATAVCSTLCSGGEEWRVVKLWCSVREYFLIYTSWGITSCRTECVSVSWANLLFSVRPWKKLSLLNSNFQHLFFCSPLLLGNFHCFSVPPLRQPGRSEFPSAGPTSAAAALFCLGPGGRCQPLTPLSAGGFQPPCGDTWHGPCQRKAEPIWADGLSYIWGHKIDLNWWVYPQQIPQLLQKIMS